MFLCVCVFVLWAWVGLSETWAWVGVRVVLWAWVGVRETYVEPLVFTRYVWRDALVQIHTTVTVIIVRHGQPIADNVSPTRRVKKENVQLILRPPIINSF